jgi:predicted nucleic acid-binding Zn ribbon protein
VFSVTDPYGRILGFLDRNRYLFFRVASELYSFKTEPSKRHDSLSQRPLGLRQELSSPAPTLRSWVRMPFESWMSVCVYSVFLLSCV